MTVPMEAMPRGRHVGPQRAFLQSLGQVKEKAEVVTKGEEVPLATMKWNRHW